MVDCHWLCVAGAHVALTDSKLMVQMMLKSAEASAELEYDHLLSPVEAVSPVKVVRCC
jgi:hypothetical protein